MDTPLILGRYQKDDGLVMVNKLAALSPAERRRHVYIIGGTGVGKSTLLLNIAAQDMARGDGLLLLDPHGDLAEAALDLVPRRRGNQVCYLNLPDLAHPVGLNVLEDPKDADDRAGVVDGVVSAMRAAWPDSWGPRMEHILRHALLALIATEGASLAMLPRFLTDQSYRGAVLARLDDPFIRAFFAQEFERWSDRFREEAVAPILNKVGGFLAFPAIRHVLGQGRSSLDLGRALARGRIVIVNLAKGLIGESATNLMGAMLIGALKTAALARAALPANERRDFHLIVDEAQSFTTEAMATLLSEARKYGMTLTLANQHLAQLPEALRGAVLGNAGTLMVFRVGAEDARLLAAEFSDLRDFKPGVLQWLPHATAYARLCGWSRVDALDLFPPPAPGGRLAVAARQSRRHYGRRRALVEEKLRRIFARDEHGARHAPESYIDPYR